jgi:hypothetical protein
MRNFFIPAIFLVMLAACNDSKPAGPEGPNQPGIQNVNGNIPDTVGTINLGGNSTVDSSSMRDSL